MSDFDVAVVGLGGIGSAAAYWAARRPGVRVLGVEQFKAGHDRGGSEDHSRIIRLSYHTPAYVALARQAYTAWRAVEEEAGGQLLLRTGGLDLAPAGAGIGLDSYRESMSAAGVDFEELDAAEVMRRWPQWRLDDDVAALYQDEAGIAMASRANATHRQLAAEAGADLVTETAVTSIREVGDEVELVVGGRAHRAGALVIAAGAWTNRMLAHLGVEFPLEVTLEQVVYLEPADAASYAPERFPIWIWLDDPGLYGFPVFGEPALKVAWDRCAVVTDAEHRPMDPDDQVTDLMRRFVADHLVGADAGVRVAKTCLYTLTPDRDFVVDRVPGTSRCFVAVGAGHAFKFASLLGRALVELAMTGESTSDLSSFRADRAILRDPDPPRRYLV